MSHYSWCVLCLANDIAQQSNVVLNKKCKMAA